LEVKGTGSIKEISFPLTIGRFYKTQDLNPKLHVIMCCPNTIIGFVTRVQIMSNRSTQAMMIYMHEMVESELSLAITHVTEDSQKTG